MNLMSEWVSGTLGRGSKGLQEEGPLGKPHAAVKHLAGKGCCSKVPNPEP